MGVVWWRLVMRRTTDDALRLFREGYNCCQSVLGALGPPLGLPIETCLRLGAAMGGGGARSGGTCGAVLGALMALGLAGPEPEPTGEARERCYAAGQELLCRFRAVHGAIECRALTGIDLSTPEGLETYRQAGLHHTFCPKFVRDATQWASALLRTAGYKRGPIWLETDPGTVEDS